MKILVIDDDDMARHVYCEALNFEGAKTMQAANVEEASILLVDNQFDLVLTDNRLPDGFGVDLINKFKPLCKLTKFVLSSADYDIQCKNADKFLPKPLSYSDLIALVKNR
jgi:DNA-binding NtrC family response regulator